MTTSVNELLEKQNKAQEHIVLLQQEVTQTQEESKKRVVHKLEDERKLSLRTLEMRSNFISIKAWSNVLTWLNTS